MPAKKKSTTKRPAKKTAAKSTKKKDESKAVNYVRGGSICDPKMKGAHLIRGSGNPAVCRTTPGPDSRPRWRQAGK